MKMKKDSADRMEKFIRAVSGDEQQIRRKSCKEKKIKENSPLLLTKNPVVIETTGFLLVQLGNPYPNQTFSPQERLSSRQK